MFSLEEDKERTNLPVKVLFSEAWAKKIQMEEKAVQSFLLHARRLWALQYLYPGRALQERDPTGS